jgi:D-alanine-D-alanine ligase
MALPRVLILHNQPVLPSHHPEVESEHEILYTVEAVEQALTGAGFHVGKLGVSHEPASLVHGVQRFRPDVVFNLFEGTGDDGNTEVYAAGLLSWLRVPFTGCPVETLSLARNKALTKHFLRSAGLPTPDFVMIEHANVPECPLPWPVIVKPALLDGSVGLDQGSVVCNQRDLELRVACLQERFGGPVLVEEFIGGREFNVAVVELPELTVLAVSEILFTEKKPGYWPIVTYDAKWRPETEEYIATPATFTAKMSPRLAKRLADIAKAAFRLTGCRDYARIDYRVRAPGRTYILEVNPNPDLSPDAGVCGGLKVAGLSYEQFAVQMVHNALARASRAAEFDLPEMLPALQPAS